MLAPEMPDEGDVTMVTGKPSRLAPLKKSPTSKASVENFFRVSPPQACSCSSLGFQPAHFDIARASEGTGRRPLSSAVHRDSPRLILIFLQLTITLYSNTGRSTKSKICFRI